MANDETIVTKFILEGEERLNFERTKRELRDLTRDYQKLIDQVKASDRAEIEGNRAKILSREDYNRKVKEANDNLRRQNELIAKEDEARSEKKKRQESEHTRHTQEQAQKQKAAHHSVTAELESMAGRYLTVAAAIEGARKSFTAFADHTRDMNRLGFAVKASADELHKWEEQVKKLSAATGIEMGVLNAEVRKFASQTGLSLGEASKYFDTIVHASHLAGVEVGIFSNLAGGAIRNLKIPFNELEDVVKHWAKTIPPDMLRAFSSVLPQITAELNLLGITGKQFALDFGAMMKVAGSSLSSPQEAAQELGKLLKDAATYGTQLSLRMYNDMEQVKNGTMSTAEAMKRLHDQLKAAGGFATGQQGKAIREIFGVSENQAIMLKKMVDGWKDVEENAKSAAESVSAFNKAAEAAGKEPVAALNRLSVAFETLKIQSGAALDTLGGSAALNILSKTIEQYSKLEILGYKLGALAPGMLLPFIAARNVGAAAVSGVRGLLSGGDTPPPAAVPVAPPGKPTAPMTGSGVPYTGKFATGGAFTVPGQGGTDTQPVGFMATPGERVAVQTPMQESLQVQQDKADIALREHFARFRGDAFSKMAAAPWWPGGAGGGKSGGGGGGPSSPGTGGAAPGSGAGTGGTGGTDGPAAPPTEQPPGGGPPSHPSVPAPLGLPAWPAWGQNIPEPAVAASGGIGFGLAGGVQGLPGGPSGRSLTADERKAAGAAPSTGGTSTGVAGNYLQQERARFAEEMTKNPQLRNQVAAILSLEHESDPTAVAESLMNRMNLLKSEGGAGTLQQGLFNNGKPSFYNPIRKGLLPGRVQQLLNDPARMARMQAGIDAALAGSNLIKGATDQGSPGDPNAQHPGGLIIRHGEHYNDWGGSPRGHAGAKAYREEQQRRLAAGGPAAVAAAPTSASATAAAPTNVAVAAGDSRVRPGASLKNVDPILVQAIHEGSKFLPEGYTIRPTSGQVGRTGSGYHPPGKASDWRITGPDGKDFPNRGWGAQESKMHADVARGAYGWLLKNHPQKAAVFEWGGAFDTSAGSGVSDIMHYDFGGARGRYANRRIRALGPLYPGQGGTQVAGPGVPAAPPSGAPASPMNTLDAYGRTPYAAAVQGLPGSPSGPAAIRGTPTAAAPAAPVGWSPDMPYEYGNSHPSWYGNFDYEGGLTPIERHQMAPYYDKRQSDTNAQYGERAIQPGSKGWNDYIGAQIDRAAKGGGGFIEFDNLDHAYKRDPTAVRAAYSAAAARGLQVLLKNPTAAQIKDLGAMKTEDGRYVVGGSVFEQGAMSPEQFAAARGLAGRPNLPATFVRHGNQKVPDVSNVPYTTSQHGPGEYKGMKVVGKGPTTAPTAPAVTKPSATKTASAEKTPTPAPRPAAVKKTAAIATEKGDFSEGRFMGGPTKAGKPYMVGEAGPELMVPGQSGTVFPGQQLEEWEASGEMVGRLRDFGTGIQQEQQSKRGRGGKFEQQHLEGWQQRGKEQDIGPGNLPPGMAINYSSALDQYRAIAAEMSQPIKAKVSMDSFGPMDRRPTRRVSDQAQRDVWGAARDSSHSDLGFV